MFRYVHVRRLERGKNAGQGAPQLNVTTMWARLPTVPRLRVAACSSTRPSWTRQDAMALTDATPRRHDKMRWTDQSSAEICASRG